MTGGSRSGLSWQVERVHCSAGGSHPLDDRWGVAGDLAWVIDGATDISHELLFPGSDGNASWLADQVSRSLAARDGAGSAVDRLAAAIARVDALATAAGVEERLDFPTAVGVLAVPVASVESGGGPGVEFTVIGDCLAAVEIVRGSEVTLELITDPAWAPGAPNAASSDPPWSSLSPDELLLTMQAGRRRRNTPEGRWIIRREPAAAEHAHVQVVGQTTGRVVLFSDGAERALRRPGFTLRDLFTAAFEDPDTFVAELHAWEDTEPPQLPRWWTPHDDVTTVALTIVPG